MGMLKEMLRMGTKTFEEYCQEHDNELMTDAIYAWQVDTFGTEAKLDAILMKLQGELDEFYMAKTEEDKIEEAADCFIVMVQATKVAGVEIIPDPKMSLVLMGHRRLVDMFNLMMFPVLNFMAGTEMLTEVQDAVFRKMEVNCAREWNISGGIGQHKE